MLEEFFENGHRFPEQSLEASIRFEDLMALPSLVEEGVITLPPKKPERKPKKIEVSDELLNQETTAEE
jgi:hypothetical protein